jgi:hypothetical protein
VLLSFIDSYFTFSRSMVGSCVLECVFETGRKRCAERAKGGIE